MTCRGRRSNRLIPRNLKLFHPLKSADLLACLKLGSNEEILIKFTEVKTFSLPSNLLGFLLNPVSLTLTTYSS